MSRCLKRSAVLALASLAIGAAQAPEPAPPGARAIQSQVFLTMRAEAQEPQKKSQQPDTRTKAVPQNNPTPAPGQAFVGLTLWKMVLASEKAQVKLRGFKHPQDDKSGTKDWTAQRLTLDRPVSPNDYVRFTFESAPQGYLYVFNRDAFSDGSLSEPILIYPTRRIRGGRNDVQAGRPVQIPDPSDVPPALQVDPPKPGQTGILLIVIATPQPLSEIQVGSDQQPVPEELLKRWEKQWATNVEISDDAKLNGITLTLAEQSALSDSSSPLGPNDLPPVTLFHRRGSAGQPIYASALIRLEVK